MGKDPVTDETKAATAVTGWNAFAAEGRQRMIDDAALNARLGQLFPRGRFADDTVHQPKPVQFYGPGPDGRVKFHDPPMGTLHFARYRHELAAIEDPEGDGYYHEDNPVLKDGLRIRPKYTTQDQQTAIEVNYFRWQMVTAESQKGVKTYPGAGTKRYHDGYLLNQDDFNDPDTKQPNINLGLNNRHGEEAIAIYPRGHTLLKQWSTVNGHGEWQDGQCLGANVNNPDALTKHLGWFPKRLRHAKAGLGADPQDVIWKEVFHGNVNAKPKEKFVSAKDTWYQDPEKVTPLTSSKDSHKTLNILSLEALKATLAHPEADTLDARQAWLAARAAERGRRQPTKAMTRKGQATISQAEPVTLNVAEKLQKLDITTDSATGEVVTKSTKPITHVQPATTGLVEKLQELQITKKSDTNQVAEKTQDSEEPEPQNLVLLMKQWRGEKVVTTSTLRHSEKIETVERVEGPIIEYSPFRSMYLGEPVYVVLGQYS